MHGHPRRVLVIGLKDDAPALRELSAFGYELRWSADEAHVLHDLRDGSVAAVLVEVSSQQIGSLEVVTKLRQDAVGSAVRIVVMGPRADRFVAQAREAGAHAVLTTPVGVADLLAAVRGKSWRRDPVLAGARH